MLVMLMPQAFPQLPVHHNVVDILQAEHRRHSGGVTLAT